MPSSTVIPDLPCRDVHAASQWLSGAFGFTPRLVIGSHRIQLLTGEGGDVVLFGAADPALSSIMVRVTDADTHCERARSLRCANPH
jgi:hypothetical protein